jgi:hypothetical protein
MASIARLVDGWQHKDRRFLVEGRQHVLSHRSEEFDVMTDREPPKQEWILTLRRRRIMAGGANHPQVSAGRKRADQTIHTLMRRKPADEEHAAAESSRVRCKPVRVSATVNDTRACWWGTQFACGVGRYREEAFKQAWEEPGPVPTSETVVGHHHVLAPSPAAQRRHAAGSAAHMMSMHHIGIDERRRQTGRQRVGRMAAEECERPQRAHPQAPRLAMLRRPAAEGQQLTVDVRGERAGQLEWVALTAPKQARGAKWCWSDMDDTHVRRSLADAR